MSALFILTLYLLAILLLYWYLQHFSLFKQKMEVQWFENPILLKADQPFSFAIDAWSTSTSEDQIIIPVGTTVSFSDREAVW